MALCLPLSQHKGAMQHREGGNYPVVPASIPAQVRHAGSGGWKLSRCACQYPSTRVPYAMDTSGGWQLSRCACHPSTKVPCSIGRVEIIPLCLPASQHKCAMQDREGGNYPAAPASIPAQGCHRAITHREGGNDPAAPASIPAQGCHAGSGGWKLSRCACQYPSTRVPCSIGRVEIIPLRLPVSQHKCAMQHREGGNYPAAPASIPAQGCHRPITHREGGNDPAAPASIPAQGCHAGSGGWKLSR
jgi:hypothetical protein